MVILPEIPQGRRTSHEEDTRTKSNGSSQLRNGTEAHEKGNPERSKQHSKQPTHRHGMMHKQSYKLSGAQHAMKLHFEENTT